VVFSIRLLPYSRLRSLDGSRATNPAHRTGQRSPSKAIGRLRRSIEWVSRPGPPAASCRGGKPLGRALASKARRPACPSTLTGWPTALLRPRTIQCAPFQAKAAQVHARVARRNRFWKSPAPGADSARRQQQGENQADPPQAQQAARADKSPRSGPRPAPREGLSSTGWRCESRLNAGCVIEGRSSAAERRLIHQGPSGSGPKLHGARSAAVPRVLPRRWVAGLAGSTGGQRQLLRPFG